MFDFFKKKKKSPRAEQVPQVEKKRKSCTQEEEIAYLEAKDSINDMMGIMSRYIFWLRELGKDQSDEEKAHIAWIDERQSELGKEKQKLDLFNEALNTKVWHFYAPLIKEYFEMPMKSDKEIAEKGLPEKYVTTKVDLSEFDTDKGA